MFAPLTFALATLSAPVPAAAAPSPSPDSLIAQWVRASSEDRPRINVWVNNEDAYQRGDQARVYFKSDRDAYVTIFRIDTDGRVRILFPIDPWEDNWARAGRTFEVLGRDDDEAFRVDDYPGVGYIFAIASTDEFDYDEILRGDHWDYRNISDGRIRGDPYVAVSDLAEKIAKEGDYDYDVGEYYVEKHYDYPRFVCYDCHTYATYRYWDPYSSYCSRFRIVIYNDWYYYPYRRYGGGVVVGRPYRPGPRYVFKDSDPRNDYITRVAERPRNDPSGPRRPPERDRTSADVGGRGSIPTPLQPRRRTGDGGTAPQTGTAPEPRRRTDPSGEAGGTRTPDQNEPRRRPDQPDAGGTRTPDQAEPRRRPETPDAGGTRTPDQSEPRRRPSADDATPQPNRGTSQPDRSDDRPRRRGIEERPDDGRNHDRATRSNGSNSDRRAPSSDNGSSRAPTVRAPESGRDRSSGQDRAEPRRAPERSEPRSAPAPRAEPRSAPAPRAEPRSAPPQRAEPRSAPAPRSTGEPSLRRRPQN